MGAAPPFLCRLGLVPLSPHLWIHGPLALFTVGRLQAVLPVHTGATSFYVAVSGSRTGVCESTSRDLERWKPFRLPSLAVGRLPPPWRHRLCHTVRHALIHAILNSVTCAFCIRAFRRVAASILWSCLPEMTVLSERVRAFDGSFRPASCA